MLIERKKPGVTHGRIQYKIDILAALKEAGYTTYKIRQEGLISEPTLTKIRAKEPISWEKLAVVCELLNCQPGDLLEYQPDTTEII